MSLAKNRKKFENYKKSALEKAEKQSNSSGYSNPNQIKFEAGKTYRLRLLFDEPAKGSHRDGPFVETYTHGAKDTAQKWQNVTCPTTHGRDGWDKCDVCQNNQKLWDGSQAGNSMDKELYDKYKRKFNGFALCYVVNDPSNPENNGHVKFFRYSIRQKRWLDREINGIISKNYGSTEDEEADEDIETVGFDAFDLEKGVDLIATISQQGKFLNYEFKFSRKSTSIDADIDQLEAEIKEVNFDQYLKDTTPEELQHFYRTVVLESGVDEIDTADSSSDAGTDIDTDDLEAELDAVAKTDSTEDAGGEEEINKILEELGELDD